MPPSLPRYAMIVSVAAASGQLHFGCNRGGRYQVTLDFNSPCVTLDTVTPASVIIPWVASSGHPPSLVAPNNINNNLGMSLWCFSRPPCTQYYRTAGLVHSCSHCTSCSCRLSTLGHCTGSPGQSPANIVLVEKIFYSID